MAYYDALIAAWSSPTQPPTGFIGTPITGGMTTAQKLAAVNGWTETGSIPTNFVVSGTQLLSCLDYTEFFTLTAAQQSAILSMCQMASLDVGSATNLANWFGSIYAGKSGGPTMTAFIALAKGSVVPWWQANGYSSPITGNDLVAAGGLT